MVIFENVTAAVPGGRYVHNFSGDHVIFDDADLVSLHERPDDVSRMVKICHECSDQIACISCMYRKRVLYVLVAFDMAMCPKFGQQLPMARRVLKPKMSIAVHIHCLC